MGANRFLYYNGSLAGDRGSDPEGWGHAARANFNAYHPVITLTLGTALQFFTPHGAILAWQLFKLIITLLMVFFLISRYAGQKDLDFSLFLYLAYFPQYNEMMIAQYQFLITQSLLLFLVYFDTSYKKGSYFLLFSLFVKPIALVMYPVSMLRKNFTTTTICLVTFLALTLPFFYQDIGHYYFKIIAPYFQSPQIVDSLDMYSLTSVLYRTFKVPANILGYIKFIFLIGVLLLTFIKKIPTTTILFGLMVNFILFGFSIFEYHLTIYIPFFVYCFINEKDWDNLPLKTLAVICSGPSLYFVMEYLSYGILHHQIQEPAWPWVNLSRSIPIMILFGILLYKNFQVDKKITS
jgi:hypothetical protein